ncbi:histidine phosphatase family protein [Phenylobacterium sp. Root700]|uniref:histidine phosphatase family protein n=1 Tax=Phenylobacterium sp. Root700 TaxID=1736591 RepID=UPI0006F6D4CA|nr:histidine phosphatase family protein [Phenylobacterium sp. Root700]KRB40383.1 phosphoglycerate kinase [Phenylobacterium sp. Root700]
MIYLVRHGETEFNAERRMQGHLDSALTATGKAQAQAIARLLVGQIGGDSGWRIVASPLGRAQHTAQIIGEALALPVETDRRVIEVSFGQWDGRLRDELSAEFPDTFGRGDWQFAAPGGESYESVEGRVAGWLADLPPEPQRKIIVVCHGGSGRVVRGAYLGLPRAQTWAQPVPQDAIYRLANGAIERFDCELSAQS